jgi:arylsulfatase A-like enzyme
MAGLPPAPQGPAVLAELFARAGYASGLFTGNGYVFYQADRGFDRVEESTLFERHPEAPYNDNAERVHAAALAWLARLPPEQPVFLYVHTVHPHNPYVPPPALARRFTAGIDSQIPADTKTLLAAKHGRIPLGESDRERIRALYRAGVAYNDAELAGFLATLADRVPAPELLAIFTADHGEELFDHGGLLHGYTLHREQLQVPLTFWWPGRLAPRKVEPPTDHVDLHTTLRRLLDPAAPAAPGSRDLWPVLTGAAALPEERLRFAAAAGVPGGIFSVQSPRLKLVWAPREGAGWGQGEGLGRARDAVALYDLAADPLETVNMAGAETVEVAWLRSRLLAWIAHHRPQAEPAAPEPATAEQRENLEALGYVE